MPVPVNISPMTVEKLTREEKPEIVSVLVAAFYNYPVMRFILRNSPDYEIHLKAIMEFYSEARLSKMRPVLGVRADDSLVAVALVDVSSLKPWFELKTELVRLKTTIGEEAYSRLELYETKTAGAEPAYPHHFLGMLAVRPEHRGKGYSRMLLEEVRRLSITDPESSGICLTTEDPENVRLYQHFGYQVVSETDIEDLHSWCMFLRTR